MRHLLTRAALLGVTAWFAAAGATGTVAWRAVSVLNAGGESTGLLSRQEVRGALDDAQARATATPRPVPTSSPAVVPSAASGAVVARTWALAGGTVAASCTGPVIALLYATPQDGWTVEVHSPGPEALEVELHRGELESVVRATCVDDEPVPEISEGDDDTGRVTAVSPAPGPTQPSTPVTTTPGPTPSPHESEDEAHEEDPQESPSPSKSPSPSESPESRR